ncbi:DUF3089 domain-containing protein [Phenylobacterium sp.]|uniref:DUF3089 domain-containing protein n=1 Tax=Phenylobacterium sp. TaxID=1871053 RepID=UPI0027353A00|nr:DUF3089 domain-containing protein [Phenylobacterium sp.]MDP3855296.1 DUF3089 domain-containing protein [Phenylobacterium sp.]
MSDFTKLLLSLAAALAVQGLSFKDATAMAPADSATPLDYADVRHWVCRPDLPGACRDDLDAAVLEASGAVWTEPFRPAASPKADCFYVYPTVSESPGLTAEPVVTEAERRAVRQQVERLSSLCRLFVPFYRQITATSMKPDFEKPSSDVQALAGRTAEADIIAAWDHYISHDNGGRPVILIGHSQGAAMVINLIRERIDDQLLQARLVSAILPGWFVQVPVGKLVGGTFKAIPPCQNDRQTGCVIAYNAVRAERPIPTDKVFHHEGQQQVCTNPAALGGGAGVLRPYLSTRGETIIPAFTAPQPDWTQPPIQIGAPFVTAPGLYSAECRNDEHGVYLAISTTPQPSDRRTGAIAGDWMMSGSPEPTMGLHLIDLNLAVGNLIDVLQRQIAAMPERP